jgi:hypothetical protein
LYAGEDLLLTELSTSRTLVRKVFVMSRVGGHDLVALEMQGTLLCRRCCALIPHLLSTEDCPKANIVPPTSKCVAELEQPEWMERLMKKEASLG